MWFERFFKKLVDRRTVVTGVAKKQEENNNLPGLDLPEHKLIFARAFTHVPIFFLHLEIQYKLYMEFPTNFSTDGNFCLHYIL